MELMMLKMQEAKALDLLIILRILIGYMADIETDADDANRC